VQGILIYNASFCDGRTDALISALVRAFEALGAELAPRCSQEFRTVFTEDGRFMAEEFEGGGCNAVKGLGRPDFILFFDKDVRLARALEKAGMRVFNNAKAIETCDSKLLTFERLSGLNIHIPATIAAPLVFNAQCSMPNVQLKESTEKFLKVVADRLGFPLVVKEDTGSLGMQVRLVENNTELNKAFDELKFKPHLYQQYIKSSAGKDIRIYTIGRKAVYACRRTSLGGFKTNLARDVKVETVTPKKSYVGLAEKISRRIGLDYAAVDFLESDNGAPVLCEVNSNAFFGAALDNGVNIAELYAKHIIKETMNK